ncbi:MULTISPECIES: ABC transporter ATP-binding protein [unclassified Isoptericola]|uniref:ABC transporter ATP-binding protein n=1 Tax=Isoptericola sp. NPDC057191 TaxID=3346041 RepID=UPI00363F390C
MSAVHVDRISHSFGRRSILRDVSFSVDDGTSLALMGRTGSGKSMLLSIVAGLERPTRGAVKVAGTSVSAMRPRQAAEFRLREVGVVFQAGELIPTLSALENTTVPLLLAGVDRTEAESRARDLLAGLAVADPSTPAESLSGGEVQRVAIARALVNEPSLVLADEPTAALDATTRDLVCDLLFNLPAERSCALIVISHDEEVAGRADRVLVLEDGRLTARHRAQRGTS